MNNPLCSAYNEKAVNAGNPTQSNAGIIYDSVADAYHGVSQLPDNYDIKLKYDIKRGSDYDQFWCSKPLPNATTGEMESILLQVSKRPSGNVELSIHGLGKISEHKNRVCYVADHDIFMTYFMMF